MARSKKGEPVNKVMIKNPVAVSIVNERASRDHLDAGTAAAVMLIEYSNQQDKSNPESGRGQGNSKRNFLDGMRTK